MKGDSARGRPGRRRAAIPLAVLLVCAGYFLLWPEAPSVRTDSGEYLQVAADLADLRLDAPPARPPLYPLLVLVATGGSAEPGRLLFLLQLSLHAASILLLVDLLRRCRVRPVWIALLAIHQLLPSVLLKTSFVLSETTSQFLVVLGVWGLTAGLAREGSRRRALVVACTALALLPLGHSVFRLLPLVLAVALLGLSWAVGQPSRRPRWAALGLISAWLLLVPGWSSYVGSSPGPVSTAERILNKLGGVAESLPEDAAGFREVLLEERDRRLVESRDHRVDGYVVRAWPRLLELAGGDEERVRAYVGRSAIGLLRAEPRAYARAVASSAIRFWEPRREPMAGFRARIWGVANLVGGALESLAWLTLAAGFALLLVVVGLRSGSGTALLWGAVEVARRQRFLAISAVVLLYVFLVAVGVGTGVPRYRWPVHGLSVAAAALVLDTLLGFRTRLGRALTAAVPATTPESAEA